MTLEQLKNCKYASPELVQVLKDKLAATCGEQEDFIVIKIVLVPYLIVSVTTFLFLTITALAITEIIKAKYGKETIKKWSSNNGVFGTIQLFEYVNSFIYSYYPNSNNLYLYD